MQYINTWTYIIFVYINGNVLDHDHNFNKEENTINKGEENEGLLNESGGNGACKQEDAAEDSDVCNQCGYEPCVVVELEEMLVAIKQSYIDIKSNNQIRFIMYKESVTHIYGRGLGKGVRKMVPKCIERKIHSMAPSAKYKGFVEAKQIILASCIFLVTFCYYYVPT